MTGSGTELDPYIISDVDDLQAIEDNLASYYELGGNIDASATSEWNANAGFAPISLFAGQLDGKDYTISSLFIDRASTQDIGLMGKLDGNNGAVLKNIIMIGVNITGQRSVGALVGYIYGLSDPVDIDDCNSAGSITATERAGGLIGYAESGAIDDCHSSCTVIVSGDYAGGLIAQLVYEGVTLTNCYATGSVTGGIGGSDLYFGGLVGASFKGVYSKCYTSGDVTGSRYAGGLIGRSQYDTISNCYARGDIDASTGYFAGGLIGRVESSDIDNCYSTGKALAVDYAGGLIGDESSGTVTNCFWDTETSENDTSDGGTGKTTAEMKTESTFTDAGWDFTTPIWYIDSSINNGYPAFEGVILVVGRRHWWIEGKDIHWFGESGTERKKQGVAVASDHNILPWLGR